MVVHGLNGAASSVPHAHGVVALVVLVEKL
jgi:hypothetical protein